MISQHYTYALVNFVIVILTVFQFFISDFVSVINTNNKYYFTFRCYILYKYVQCQN